MRVNHDFAEDKFVQINLEVYKYLLNQKYIDINTPASRCGPWCRAS